MAKRYDPFSAWFQTSLAMNAASVTVAIRLYRMQQAMLSGDPSGGPEARRMVKEKVAAGREGYFRGAKAMTALMLAPPATAAGCWNSLAVAAFASAGPGYAKARANARRLTKLR